VRDTLGCALLIKKNVFLDVLDDLAIGIKSHINCESAICVCILETQITGTPESIVTYPVCDFAEIGCCPSSTLNTPEVGLHIKINPVRIIRLE
jgi:hypothetical protein